MRKSMPLTEASSPGPFTLTATMLLRDPTTWPKVRLDDAPVATKVRFSTLPSKSTATSSRVNDSGVSPSAGVLMRDAMTRVTSSTPAITHRASRSSWPSNSGASLIELSPRPGANTLTTRSAAATPSSLETSTRSTATHSPALNWTSTGVGVGVGALGVGIAAAVGIAVAVGMVRVAETRAKPAGTPTRATPALTRTMTATSRCLVQRLRIFSITSGRRPSC